MLFTLLFGLFMLTAYAPSKGVDAGIVNYFVAAFYLGPCAALFALAAMSVSKQWKYRRALYRPSLSFAVLSFISLGVYARTGDLLDQYINYRSIPHLGLRAGA